VCVVLYNLIHVCVYVHIPRGLRLERKATVADAV